MKPDEYDKFSSHVFDSMFMTKAWSLQDEFIYMNGHKVKILSGEVVFKEPYHIKAPPRWHCAKCGYRNDGGGYRLGDHVVKCACYLEGVN